MTLCPLIIDSNLWVELRVQIGIVQTSGVRVREIFGAIEFCLRPCHDVKLSGPKQGEIIDIIDDRCASWGVATGGVQIYIEIFIDPLIQFILLWVRELVWLRGVRVAGARYTP
jgi:hypothetical protein